MKLLLYEENMRALSVCFRRVFAIALNLFLEHRCHRGQQQDAMREPRLPSDNILLKKLARRFIF